MWSSFGPFWSVKYRKFWQNLPIQIAHYTFLKSRHTEVTKDPYYVLLPKGSQKKLSAHGLYFLRVNQFINKVINVILLVFYCLIFFIVNTKNISNLID